MSSEEEPVAWLRKRIGERMYLARRAIELGNAAVWHEPSSGVLVTGEPTETDVWHGTWPMGDSSLARLMEANDPQDTIARCEAELAILDACLPDASMEAALERGDISTEEYMSSEIAGAAVLRLLASGYKHWPGYREEDLDGDVTPFQQAMRDEMRAREQERFSREYGCPACGRSATGAEWDLLKFAKAMNATLRRIRYIAEVYGGNGEVHSGLILEALNTPYRFPLPDAPEAEAG